MENRTSVTLHATDVAHNVTEQTRMQNPRYVAYYRVSTQRQGRSGLGLDAQRKSIIDRLCVKAQLIAEYTEIESGKRTDRPKLVKALAACGLHRAILIISKLDRLARNVAFVSNLMEAGVEFEAVDFPTANRLTIHILAAVAEHEAKMISDRTRSALAAAKARGIRLSGFRGRAGTCNDLLKARAVRPEKANRRASDLSSNLEEIRIAGGPSLHALAAQRVLLTSRTRAWIRVSISPKDGSSSTLPNPNSRAIASTRSRLTYKCTVLTGSSSSKLGL